MNVQIFKHFSSVVYFVQICWISMLAGMHNVYTYMLWTVMVGFTTFPSTQAEHVIYTGKTRYNEHCYNKISVVTRKLPVPTFLPYKPMYNATLIARWAVTK